MALFGNKSKDPQDAPDAKPARRSLNFGRKKDAAPDAAPAAQPAVPASSDDFSDFSDTALTGQTNGAPTYVAPAPVKRAKPKGMKNGAVIGLNIGTDSIKAIELRGKGGDLYISALGMVPTPPDSIANGVVTSVHALSGAIKDLFKQAGIKSRGVVTSVSGTGALIVRIIEVPKMSDTDLADNMKMDADRYIPFPPSEVVMDFKALRELPTDPDAPNMEVLLAAAQREIVDLHIRVLQETKLEPQAIDVEPLAAARAVMYRAGGQAAASSDLVDYNDVSALINMGASSTEISVLRGDILVFTRSIPSGGHTLTQALVDQLGLPWASAERIKREMGDALSPHGGAVMAPAGAAHSGDDWSEFGITDTPNDEPTGRHGQKEDEEKEEKPAPGFDFSSFGFADDDPLPAPQTSSAPAAPAPEDQPIPASEPDQTPSSFDFSPSPTSAGLESASRAGDDVEASAPATSADAAQSPDPFNFNMDLEAPVTPPAAASTNVEGSATPLPFSFDMADEPAAPTPQSATIADDPTSSADTGTSDAGATPAGQAASAYDFGDFNLPPTPATAGAMPPTLDLAATGAAATATPAASSADFDLDSLFGSVTGPVPGGAATLTGPTPTAEDQAVAPTDMNFDATAFGMPSDSAADAGTDMGSFGAGLTDTLNSDVQPDTVHAILYPLLDELTSEIRRSLEYYASRYPDAGVRHVHLIGGGAQLKNLDAFLTQMLGVPCTVNNPLLHIPLRAPQLSPDFAAQYGPVFAVPFGLALRDLV